MKTLSTFSVISFLFFTFNVSAQISVSLIGQKTLGGTGLDVPSAIVATMDGGYLVGGASFSGISGDKTENSRGDQDYWIVKLDEQLTEVWQHTFGGDSADDFTSMVANADGTFILGGNSSSNISGDKTAPKKGFSDYWVLKLDADGNEVWQNTYGADLGELMWKMIALPSGDILLAGSSNSGISGDKTAPSKGGTDYWLVAIDADGNKLWDKSFGGMDDDYSEDVQIFGDKVILSGISWSNTSGDKSEDDYGSGDSWVIALDTVDWNPVWDITLGGTSFEIKSQMAVMYGRLFVMSSSDSDISGTKSENSHGSSDYWITCLDMAGSILWDRTIGGDSYEDPRSLIPTTYGNVLAVGGSLSDASYDKDEDSKGLYDFWPVSIDTIGNIQWQATIGGSMVDVAIAAVEPSPGRFVLTGMLKSDADGDKTENNRGDNDYWIVEIATSVGISEADPLELNMYPNPAYEQLQITWKDAKSSCAGLIQLYDADGRMVQQQNMQTTTATIPTGQLPQANCHRPTATGSLHTDPHRLPRPQGHRTFGASQALALTEGQTPPSFERACPELVEGSVSQVCN
ncbi:MAG: T9SS type A sorting domain-containing protein [Flavobacteriales bacterium]|nr:T9SS type A sorting domain-containing protein [Flavobacteriales bacterium]